MGERQHLSYQVSVQNDLANGGNIASAQAANYPPAPALQVAVLIPCYNEELSIAQVVEDFRRELPHADIYVYDNNSKDQTVEVARAAGAIIRRETRQGKGYAVQRMFQEIDADIYIMIDGDGTYESRDVQRLLAPVLNGEADMVVGSRLHGESKSEFKALNRFGNHLFLTALNSTFKTKLSDILSGYRVFNRRFVKGIAVFGGGFEIETELTIKALQRGYRVVEVPTNLSPRVEGSFSKINYFRDSLLILNTILTLFRDYKPLTFFGSIGLALMLLALIPGGIVIFEFIETGLVPRLPSAVLAVGLVLTGMLALTIGLVLHTIARRSQEFDYYFQSLADELHRARTSARNTQQGERVQGEPQHESGK